MCEHEPTLETARTPSEQGTAAQWRAGGRSRCGRPAARLVAVAAAALSLSLGLGAGMTAHGQTTTATASEDVVRTETLAPPRPADTWRLDPENAEVRFTWDHFGITRQSGEIREIFGTLWFSPTAPETGAVEISALVESISTGVPALDAALKSPDYFDAAQFSRITFTSTGVTPTGPRTGQLAGVLSIRGIEKPVTLDVTWTFTGEHPLASFNPVYQGKWVSGFQATATIKRSEWGIDRSAPLISDEIEIAISAEFIQVKSN